jgi:hypothetical protein
MKAYWLSGGIAPLICNFGTEWRWLVSLTSRPLYPRTMSPYKPIEEVGGLQCQSGRFREGKIICCRRYLTPDYSGHTHIFCEMSLGMAAAQSVTAAVTVALVLTVISQCSALTLCRRPSKCSKCCKDTDCSLSLCPTGCDSQDDLVVEKYKLVSLEGTLLLIWKIFTIQVASTHLACT